MNLESNIKRALRERGWSVRKLCKTIGMTEANMYRIFKKGSIKTETLQKIADALEFPMAYFLGEISFEEARGGEKKEEAKASDKEKADAKPRAKPRAKAKTDEANESNEVLHEKIRSLEERLADKQQIIELLIRNTKG